MEIRVGTVYSIVFAVVQIFDIFAISYAKWSTVELETDGTPKNVVPEIDLGLFQICCITFIDNNEDQSTSTELATTTASSLTSVRSKILREEPKEQQRECISWQKFYNAEKEFHENDTSEFVWDENCPNYGSRLKIPTLQSNKFDLGSSPLRQRRLRSLQELNSELKESPLPVRTQRQTVKFAGIDPLEPEEKPQKQTGNEELLRSLDKETLAKLIMMTAAKESRASTRMQPIPMPTSYSMSADEDNEYV
ncbi:Oidioi.mRNA.OKI2018_I69.chr1.g3569.t1.cds [Oikopleura dioica]|uniref:Oidioi.mRNA.OKI2018_I69.chr1.g3569.t1.cds n=1 Tax=Oikopleura dioica TaxID=34765 RepID=A0ABN7SYT6_OIKDI|nr:Oidioi.mRNA.OKI2018_I69.chr1.g3569.t1.cds [Oikopleura dioica]